MRIGLAGVGRIGAFHAGTGVAAAPVAAEIGGILAVLARAQPGVAVPIGIQRRFDAGYGAARRAVRAGALGWLHSVRAATLDPAPPQYVATSGELIRDCGVHDFDAVRWVTGREVTEAYARGGHRGADADFFAAAGDVDTTAAMLTLDDGTLALVCGTCYHAAGDGVRLELPGSAGPRAAPVALAEVRQVSPVRTSPDDLRELP